MDDAAEKRKGDWFVLSGTVLWSFFPIVTVLSYAKLPALVSLGWTTVFAAIFFGAVVLYRKRWREFRNPLLWKYIFFITLFVGVLYYGLYFLGLQRTTPGNASIIALFEVCTTFVLFNIVRKETISFAHICGAACMVVGALIVLAPNFSGINIGDFLVLAATFCSPFGNIYQRKARAIASSETIMFLRSMLSVLVIFLLAYALRIHAPLSDVRVALPFLLVNGILLFGVSKLFWIEAIHRISVTKAVALQSLAPFLTLLFAWMLLRENPSAWQLVSLVPFMLGTLLLTDQLKLGRR
jgi:drug/metabolite transporter (DMT)-like permease